MRALLPDTLPDTLEKRFDVVGVAVLEHALTASDLSLMDALFPTPAGRGAGARASHFSAEALDWLGCHEGLAAVIARVAHATDGARKAVLSSVRAFDKSPSANWFVPWHQDRAQDGRDRPIAQLERTIALRIHLDECDEDNGPLEVMAASHTLGRLESAAIGALVASAQPLLCLAVRGDIVAMRPLLVHRSQRARVPRARRVLHLEYVTGR